MSANPAMNVNTPAQPLLGKELSHTIENVTRLIAAATDINRVHELIAMRAQMVEQLAALVDSHLDQSSAQYREATESLRAASEAIGAAMQDLATVADAIRLIARVIDVVAVLI